MGVTDCSQGNCSVASPHEITACGQPFAMSRVIICDYGFLENVRTKRSSPFILTCTGLGTKVPRVRFRWGAN
eukprot:486035-Prymnesium_polylepis.1